MDKEIIKDKLLSLVNTFKDPDTKALKKSEEDIQTQFTVPLLKSLGWEAKNIVINQGQETRSEKRPDILLKDDNFNTVFVIESKDAKTKNKLDESWGELKFDMQLNKYCKAEGKSWGILTNFVEWRVYSVDPKRLYEDKKYAFYDLLWEKTEKSKYTDLLSEEGLNFFNKLSKENLIKEKGDWDKNRVYYKEQIEIEETKKTKELFFRNLKTWRSSLRSFINKKYGNIYQINDIDLITQKILDRLIFIDYCYDNDVLPQDRLSSIIQSFANKWGLLKLVFVDMNKQFNSELFSYNKKLDELEIEDEIISAILKGLNEIDFKKLPVHIIGEVYENYLGEMLKKNRGDFKVDESKEVAKKKSQGIYYTPDYIVKYIIDNTVGELLKKCKSREELSKIRVLDPACGSGSFLIQVFDIFLKHYKRVDGLKEDANTAFDFEHYNKHILQNNIYGVDLDEKAVEITKLNLMIKALSGVTVANLENRAKLLPNLNLNIRCGNSLISGKNLKDTKSDKDDDDNFKKDFSALTDLKEKFRKGIEDKGIILNDIYILEEKINSKLNKDLNKYFKNLDEVKPFNYEVSFCEVFKEGGFDCVIGNPPYITLSLGKNQKYFKDNEIAFFNDTYIYVNEYKGNTFSLFTYNSIKLTKKFGLISMIVPSTMLLNFTFQKLRQFIMKECLIKYLINIREKIFYQTEIGGNLIYVLVKDENQKRNNSINCIEIEKNSKEILSKPKYSSIKQKTYNNIYGIKFYLNNNNFSILDKIYKVSTFLENLVEFYQGIITGDNKKYLSNYKINRKYEKIIRGKDISRYSLQFNNNYIHFDKNLLWSNTDERFFKVREKIINRQTGDSLVAALDIESYFTLDSTHVQILKNNQYSLKYILGLFNSKLLNFVYKNQTQESGRIFAQVKTIYLKQLPVRSIDFNNKQETLLHDEMVKLVDEMILLNKNPEINKTKIAAKDLEIDDLVYKLYGITDEKEINIIEGKK